MNKLMQWLMPAKTVAALVFAGLVCAYMAAGALYAGVTGVAFGYTVPFIFLIQGVVLSVAIGLLWTGLLAEQRPHKLRYLPRLVVFCVGLVVALSLCFLNFFLMHTDWAKLWLIVAGLVVAGVVGLSVLAEAYFRATGKTYSDILKAYQANLK